MENLDLNTEEVEKNEEETDDSTTEYEVDGFIVGTTDNAGETSSGSAEDHLMNEAAKALHELAEPREEVTIESQAPNPERKQPVGLIRPEQLVEAMQFSTPADVEAFVAWGDNAIRFENPFLVVLGPGGAQNCNPGDWIVKVGDKYTVLPSVVIEEDYVEG